MAFVLDASIAAVWAFGDESSEVADLAMQRLGIENALVPSLWWYEVRNLLIVNERRNRISVDDSAIFLQLISRYPIHTDESLEERSIFRLARQYRLTFYDAAYLAVADRNRIPLGTLDKDLRAAALAGGVALLA